MVESWYNFGVFNEKCTQSVEAVVAFKKLLEIETETNMPEWDCFLFKVRCIMIIQACCTCKSQHSKFLTN